VTKIFLDIGIYFASVGERKFDMCIYKEKGGKVTAKKKMRIKVAHTLVEISPMLACKEKSEKLSGITVSDDTHFA